MPIATGQVLGAYVPKAQHGLIVQVCLAIMVTSIVSAAFMLLQNLTMLRMEGRIEATLQPALSEPLLRLPTKFFTSRSTGELASAAMGIGAIRRLLAGVGPTLAQAGTVGAMNLRGCSLVQRAPGARRDRHARRHRGRVPRARTVAGALAAPPGRVSNKLNNQAFQTLRGLPKLRVAAAENYAYAAWAGEFGAAVTSSRRSAAVRTSRR